MASLETIVAVGREFLSRYPTADEERLRDYLRREFLLDRNLEVVFLRSAGGRGLQVFAPLVALITRLFKGSPEKQDAQIREQVESAIKQLRAASGT